MAITDTLRELHRKFDGSTMLMKIVWINIAVFVMLRLVAIVSIFAGHTDFINVAMRYVQLPSSLSELATRPWTLVTYMFAQYDVLHILFNLLWFYWFGTLFMMTATQRQLFALYLLGGLGGAALFLLSYSTLPAFAYHSAMLIGSSASVIAIVTATAILMPDFKMHLLLFGAISLKWIAIVTIGLVLIGVTGSNAGGEIAHIGGVAVGAIYALQLKRGRDITRPLNRFFDSIANFFGGMKSSIANAFKPRQPKAPHQASTGGSRQTSDSSPSAAAASSPKCSENDREILDQILDKIKKSGYSALTPEERRRLFDVSNRIK